MSFKIGVMRVFGNVKPLKNELKLKDYSNYRAYYCGLCKSMGKKYAGLCRLGLSYEAVFIALIISAMTDESVVLKRKRCLMHPFTKRPMVVKNKSVDAAASVNVLLMYNSLCDNIKDEKDISSFFARLWLGRTYKRACGDMPEINSVIEEKLEDLSLAEESLCDVLDKAAQPFAEMMGELAERLIPHENNDIYWFGFFMGKWIYVIDAYDDIGKDIKSKAYNPFVQMYSNIPEEKIAQEARDDAEFVLTGSLAELSRIYARLAPKRNREILENILFEGMPTRTRLVLSGEGKQKNKNKDEYEML